MAPFHGQHLVPALSRSDPEALARAVAEARPFLQFRIDRILDAGDLSTAEGRARAAESALAAVAEHPVDLVRDQYVMQLADRCRLDAAKLQSSWEGHDKEEMEQVLSALKQALPTASVEQTGERATMPYGAGTMQLVREHGLWKIEDFD